MFDPFNMGMMALTALNQPDVFSKAMSYTGVSPDGVMAGQAPGALTPGDPLGGFFTQNMGAAAPDAAPGAFAGSKVDPMQMLGALGAVKAPPPTQPIFNAGVSGSQKAPEVGVGGAAKGGSAASNAILAAILGGGRENPLTVPSLGAMLGG